MLSVLTAWMLLEALADRSDGKARADIETGVPRRFFAWIGARIGTRRRRHVSLRRSDLLAGLRFLALFGAAVASFGLVFDPRYRMFPIAGFAIPAAGFALHFLLTRARTGEEAVEAIWLAVLLAVAGIVIAINERSEEPRGGIVGVSPCRSR